MRLHLPLLALLTLAGSACAQAAGGDKFVGMPVTGELDAKRVLAARYGEPPRLDRSIKGGLTGVFVDSADAVAQASVPVSFGQVFTPGDLKPGERLAGKLADGATLPLQVDVKARHADGSVRHAVVSAILPALAPKASLMLALAKDGAAAGKPALPATAAALLAQGFRAGFSARIDGKTWSVSAERLLAGARAQAWLSGPLVTEWLVAAPLVDDQGAEHPHLAARFAVRWYPQAKRARVDVTIENDWAYEPGPRNFTYDARVTVGGKEVYARAGLTHFHHARWRKVFWWGGAPAFDLRHDTAYLIASRALPNYDQALQVSEPALADLKARWNGAAIEPMGAGLAQPYMPMTGGRNDIGLLPGWAAMYLLSMDPRARAATMGGADLAGSWPIHYRDKRTGLPVSLLDHPYMTVLARASDTMNRATGKLEAFPACAADKACDTPYAPDVSHQASFAYLPYLLSGDHYHLEELQFWASYNVFSSHPGYRENIKGLLKPDQLRGQAWALRSLGEAAYITPDGDRLKPLFLGLVDNNLKWYNATYTDNPAANKLGVIVNGYALSYDNESGIAPWQDDFFTSAVGHLADLGFADARRLLAWKTRFPIGRMMDPGVCWIDAASYSLKVRESRASPFFATLAQAYAATHGQGRRDLPCGGADMAHALKLKPGEMTGYSSSAIGFPSTMQPALAYAADAAGKPGRDAWARFMGRSVKPDYGGAPQFAIVPRAAAPEPAKDATRDVTEDAAASAR